MSFAVLIGDDLKKSNYDFNLIFSAEIWLVC